MIFIWTMIGFVGMEVFSVFIHKYLFHGPLWFIHKTHHQPKSKGIELNDVFSALFAAVSMWLMFSAPGSSHWKFGVGLGITLYGLIYFVLHDIFVHRRIANKKAFQKGYFSAVQRAHWAHHRTFERDGSVSFGLLSFPVRFWNKTVPSRASGTAVEKE